MKSILVTNNGTEAVNIIYAAGRGTAEPVQECSRQNN